MSYVEAHRHAREVNLRILELRLESHGPCCSRCEEIERLRSERDMVLALIAELEHRLP